MTLPQQLEDKKKGCGYTTYVDLENQLCYMKCDCNGYCPQCQAEIAILEQAIAEKNEFIKDEIRFIEDNNYGCYECNKAEKFYERVEYLKHLIPQKKVSEVQFKALFPNIEKSPVVSNLQFPELEPKKCFSDGFDKGVQFGMQKQRQEILDEIGYKIFSEDEQKSNNVWYKKGWDDSAKRINKVIQEVKELN